MKGVFKPLGVYRMIYITEEGNLTCLANISKFKYEAFFFNVVYYGPQNFFFSFKKSSLVDFSFGNNLLINSLIFLQGRS